MVTATLDQKKFQNKINLFEAIIHYSQDGIIVFNDKFEAIFSNTAFGEMVKMEPSEIRGVSLSSFIPAVKRINHERLVQNFSHSERKQQRLDGWRAIQCCRGDGSLFNARIIINKYHISQSLIFIVSLRDMTQVLNFEKETNKAEFAQFQAEQQKRCVVKVLQLNLKKTIQEIGHNALKITTQSDPEQLQNAINEIRIKSLDATSIAQKAILLISKAGSEQVLPFPDYSLYGSIERIAMIMDEYARQKGLTLSWEVPNAVKKYQPQNAQIIEQIIYNILDDAISNATAGHIKFKIKQIHEDVECQMIVDMQCSNSRFGIAQKQINEILNAPSLSKIPSDNNLKYNGMCLRLAKYLTQEAKGQFRVISHPVEGTQVFIKLKGAIK